MADSNEPRMSVRPLFCPSQWVIDTHGRSRFDSLCREVGLDPGVLLDHSAWIEIRAATSFLSSIRALVDDDEAFKEVCSHRIREGYGPMLHVLPVASPRLLFRAIARTVRLFSSVGRGEVVDDSRTRAVLRYRTEAPELETRELCVSRLAAMIDVPTTFGLPPGMVRENACIARGDEYCEYECSFYAPNRWLPPLAGAVLGGSAAWALTALEVHSPVGWAWLPMVLALLALVWELRRTSRVNQEHAEGIQRSLEQLAANEGDARREILAFHDRQKEWGKLLEEQVAERTGQLGDVLERLEAMGEARSTTVRGVSHDLRNPLQILVMNQQLLRMKVGGNPDVASALGDNDEALSMMERMLVDLTEGARSTEGLVPVNPRSMEIEPWVEILRRRVRALTFGKEISVSAFRRREAPESIVADRLIFERVADNLCSNAAKYTARGSIVVELDGKPGFLTLKVSDTGVGIEPDRIAQIFEPGGPDKRHARSLGVGLSVVVQLMAQIGGKLEVMSLPDKGTTFWAHFPVEPPAPKPVPAVRVPEKRPRLAEVVTIRKAHPQ